MRSIPIQFCPADWKTPLINKLARLANDPGGSSTTAGSFPPNSTHTGVNAFAAEAHTAWATGREPMKVMCDMSGCEVKCEAVLGQSVRGWMRCGECPQARREACAMEAKKGVDQAVCSEVLMRSEEPVKRVEMRGPMRLWN